MCVYVCASVCTPTAALIKINTFRLAGHEEIVETEEKEAEAAEKLAENQS